METTEAVQPTEDGGLLDSVTTEDSQGTAAKPRSITDISSSRGRRRYSARPA